MIDLYTAPTPNGHKASCTLEELGMDYDVHLVNLLEGEQKKPDFLAINPNGRVPAIVDRDAGNFPIFESGAIMIYLAEKAGRLLPTDTKGRSLVMQWLMFQMAGVGPMMGQANVFYRYMPEKIPTAIDRYHTECRRLFEVLDRRLGESEWLADDYSIADIANWCWVRTYKWSGVSRDGLENLDRWLNAMKAKPGLQKGVQVPIPLDNLLEDKEAAEAFAKGARESVVTGAGSNQTTKEKQPNKSTKAEETEMSDLIEKAIADLDGKAKASGLSETVKFAVDGEGAIVIDGTGARASDEDADLTISADAETFQGIMDGSVNAQMAFMTGKIRIEGNMALAMNLGSILG